MKSYLWETHLHTAESSRCAKDDAADMIRACKAAGYHGVVVTDHFLNGNTTAPRKAPWQKRVDWTMLGYKTAARAGEKLGVAVLYGCEFTYKGADFLTFGIDEEFLRDQPDIADLGIAPYIQRVHAIGGLVCQAHPFRKAWYMPPGVKQYGRLVDGVEVFNGSHLPSEREWDDKALALAEERNLLQTAGSDAHSLRDIGTAGVAFAEAFTTAREFIEAIRQRQGEIRRIRV